MLKQNLFDKHLFFKHGAIILRAKSQALDLVSLYMNRFLLNNSIC